MTKKEIPGSRKGAVKTAAIPVAVLHELNKGRIESLNLTEWLAVDHMELLPNVLLDYPDHLKACEEALGDLKGLSVRTVIVEISKVLLAVIKESGSKENEAAPLFEYLASHPSDSVRCWAVYSVGLDPELSINEKFKVMCRFAADAHFGVRELAWMAMREDIEKHLIESIRILMDWTSSADENIRRFATEATRPRGVWCKHLQLLKAHPEMALGLLEALKADPSPYVQLSVGNWLNDAGKTQPEWLLSVCQSWVKDSTNPYTLKIVKRGSRNVNV